MTSCFSIPRGVATRTVRWSVLAALAFGLMACSAPQDRALEEFAQWHDNARTQARAGALRWSELYRESFDRLTALPSSFQQDSRLENTVLLLSAARKFEANEMTAQQFAVEQGDIEARLQARLR